MSEFNLIEEPWIPCVDVQGGRLCEHGLRGVLLGAAEIREIMGPSPLVTVAIHRLLLAVLHRVFGPSSADEWAAMWNRGQWDADRLDAYFRQCHGRFNLFDEHHPFYQARSVDVSDAGPVSKLVHDLASGNNATLFDHTFDDSGVALTPAEAARYLVAHQAFAVGGLVSFEKGQDPKYFKSANAAPLAKGAVAIVRGADLFRTLMLNLVAYDPEQGVPFSGQLADDRPAWESDAETHGQDRRPSGYLDLLTWQSRRIRLKRDTDGLVRCVVIMKGFQFPDGHQIRDAETMIAFKANPKAKRNEDAWIPIGFREDRALWRDSLALLQTVPDQRERARTLAWLADLVVDRTLDRSLIVPVDLCGMSTDKAKVLLWRHERLAFPLTCLEDPDRLAEIRVALGVAERAGTVLRQSAVRLAGALLAPKSDRNGARQPDKTALAQQVTSLGVERRYWSRLEVSFRTFLIALAGDPPSGDGLGAVRRDWINQVRGVALSAFGDATTSLDASGRTMKALALAEAGFRQRLEAALTASNEASEEVTDDSTE